MFCRNCGQEIKDGVKFCPCCGMGVEKPTEIYVTRQGGAPDSSSEMVEKAPVLGMGSFLGYRIIELIPIVGFIVMIVFAVNSPNKNRENYARGYFLFLLVQIVLIILMWAFKDMMARMFIDILRSW